MPGSAVSIDASWVTKTNSKFCIVEAIDIAQKNASFFIVDSYKKSKYKYFDKASNVMECFGLKYIIPKLQAQNKITSVFHDGDVFFDVAHDMGHLLKNRNTTFQKFNNMCSRKLSRIGAHIHDFMNNILYEDSDTSEKVKKMQTLEAC